MPSSLTHSPRIWSQFMCEESIPASQAIAAIVLAGACFIGPVAVAADYQPITPDAEGKVITLTGHDLTIEQVIEVARHGAQVKYSEFPTAVRKRRACVPKLLMIFIEHGSCSSISGPRGDSERCSVHPRADRNASGFESTTAVGEIVRGVGVATV